MLEAVGPLPVGTCPLCNAHDAYIVERNEQRSYFVECAHCGVYEATRKAFRHFEYLRWRGHNPGLTELQKLSDVLRARARGVATRLDYDTWRDFLS
jgi:hypothetical protein